MKCRAVIAVTFTGLLVVAGCRSKDETTHGPPPVRPVLTVVVHSDADQQIGFAGTIQPQFQTDRGFQVLGRIISRDVSVGDLVKPGQTLATLDPLVYDLAVRSSEADLAKALSELANTTAAEARRTYLYKRQVVNQSLFEAAQQARAAAAAVKQQAEANLDKAREQRSYTRLTADIDGVVTSVDAEVGQTVAAGKKVMTLAQLDVREAVVDLPEAMFQSTAKGDVFTIQLQADPSIKVTGKVREIAPQADSATRTRRVKITLDQVVEPFRLGATITAKRVAVGDPPVTFDIPRTALLQRDGATRVWLVDPATQTVKTTPVEVAAGDGSMARITAGLAKELVIVGAGVNSLTEGQKVKMDRGKLP